MSDGISRRSLIAGTGALVIAATTTSFSPAQAATTATALPLTPLRIPKVDLGVEQQSDAKAKSQKQAQDQVKQQTQKLVAQGVPPAQAQQQAQQQVSAQQKQQQPKQDQQAAQAKQQEKFLESKASDPRLQTLRKDLQKTGDVKSVSEPLVNKDGSAAVFTLVSSSAPSSRATEDLVNHLRDDVIPKDTKGNGMRADVGGTTAGYIDLAKQITGKLPLVIGIVLALSFVLLMLAFRSIPVPIKAVILNLLSIGAAFGIVTFAFGHSWSAQLVGLDGSVPIVSFVPLMMFAILFGLSMDYEVFLMTHMREAWQRTGDNRQAVIEGIGTTGKVITSAALIMVSVFFAFIINGDPTVKQFGVGMGVAVAIDATLVRCLLVPAVMLLVGRANWWFPGFLDRHVPNVSIEGEEWFRELDQPESAIVRSPGRT